MKRRGEAGVTLTELLIAITITTIIMGPIAGAIFVGLRTSGGTQNRVVQSVSTSLLQSYLTTDMENAVSGVSSTTANLSENAGTCPTPLITTASLVLTASATSTSPATSTSYYVVPGTGPTTGTLYRRVCTGSTNPAPVSPISRQIAGGAAGVSFTCTPPACVSVTGTMTQQSPLDTTPYVATVTAARRVN